MQIHKGKDLRTILNEWKAEYEFMIYKDYDKGKRGSL